jgi:hypothetical protein
MTTDRAHRALVTLFIIGCLGAQAVAILHPIGPGLYPFIAYPMYSSSWRPGQTYRLQELWARPCEPGQPARLVLASALGYEDNDWLPLLSTATGTDSAGVAYRAHLSALARSRLHPAVCALELWVRTIPTSDAGIDRSALEHPERTRLTAWRIDAR